MALQGKDVGEEKKTPYTFRGSEIVLSKTRGRPPTGKLSAGKPGWWSEKKRIEALTIFAVTGSFQEVQKLTSVPIFTVKSWLKQEWAVALLNEIRNENDQALDAQLTKAVHKAADQLNDRLDNGDTVVLKDGSLVRKPMSARDLALVQAINIDKRQIIRGRPTSISAGTTDNQKLEKLAEKFVELAQKTRKEKEVVIEAEYTEVKDSEKP